MGEVSLGGRHAGLKVETGDLFMKDMDNYCKYQEHLAQELPII
jgi:hypothetical protein